MVFKAFKGFKVNKAKQLQFSVTLNYLATGSFRPEATLKFPRKFPQARSKSLNLVISTKSQINVFTKEFKSKLQISKSEDNR